MNVDDSRARAVLMERVRRIDSLRMLRSYPPAGTPRVGGGR